MPRNETPPAPNEGLPTGIGAPATRALHAAGYTTLIQLTQATEAELLALHGFGPKALRIIVAALQARGLSLAEPRREKQ